jgi:hypothetical protein
MTYSILLPLSLSLITRNARTGVASSERLERKAENFVQASSSGIAVRRLTRQGVCVVKDGQRTYDNAALFDERDGQLYATPKLLEYVHTWLVEHGMSESDAKNVVESAACSKSASGSWFFNLQPNPIPYW